MRSDNEECLRRYILKQFNLLYHVLILYILFFAFQVTGFRRNPHIILWNILYMFLEYIL